MYISTEIYSFEKFGTTKEIIKMLKDAGFTAFDYSMFIGSKAYDDLTQDDYIQRAQELRAYADEIGIVCNQTHAPDPTLNLNNENFNKMIFPHIVRAIEISGILGAKVCVIHPCNDYDAKQNAQLYSTFAPYARKAGVKIGVENMWNAYHWDEPDFHALPAACSHHEDFLCHMQALPEDVFTACVDIGHAEMAYLNTSACEMIETLGSYMGCMHLHDIDGVNDNHQVPFNYKIDFNKVITSLKKIGYKGDITLECAYTAPGHPIELYEALATYMASVANYFRKKLLE